jgi:micrococcal nuclease
VLAALILAAGMLQPAGAEEPAGTEEPQPAGTEVYITETGEKYHRGDCHMLRESKIPITLEEALQRGYGPCGICDPPVPADGKADSGTEARAGQSSGGGEKPSSGGSAENAGGGNLYRVNAAGLQRWQDADLSRMLPARVVEHVDGDTVKVRIKDPPAGIKPRETIRMLGVDTPETVHPEKPVQEFGKEASEFTRRRLLGKRVLLAFDWDLRGGYGRLLAYIYHPGGGCHNAELIAGGYAHAYTRFAFQFSEQFRRLEKQARQAGRGLWGSE